MADDAHSSAWTRNLNDEDFAFVGRFLLASGSLKALAKAYSVSYPTIRLRLDRLIAKIKLSDRDIQGGELEQALRCRFIDGKIDMDTFRDLMKAHHRDLEKCHEDAHHDADVLDRTADRDGR